MKTLSVNNPWAFLICSGIKDIENRTWKTNFRGRVLIHATRQFVDPDYTKEQLHEVVYKCDGYLTIGDLKSCIIGSVEIVDCVINHSSIWAEPTQYFSILETANDVEDAIITYNWVLANPILFSTPIPNIKGKLSLWEYDGIKTEIDEDGREQCMCQLPINEKDQVMIMPNGFRCRYCGGNWYR